jgi:ornithine cyclodeaminase
MLNLDSAAVAAALPYGGLIEALNAAFASEVQAPVRIHYEVPVPQGTAGNLLLMPAWQAGGSMGVKIVTVFPDNAARDAPAVFGTYLLMSAETGVPVAVLDGTELTVRRTAAASALASAYLSREDARRLLMIGTGNLAPHLVLAHATARPIERVAVWGRRREAAGKLVELLSGGNFEVAVAEDLEEAVRDADIISSATLAAEPLIRGEWLSAGQHVDLVGAFRPDMREADDESLRRAEVFVDTRAGAFAEAGEIVQSLQNGAISETDIRGELSELCKREVEGRRGSESITLFKSVGTALEDLAAAEMTIRNQHKTPN